MGINSHPNPRAFRKHYAFSGRFGENPAGSLTIWEAFNIDIIVSSGVQRYERLGSGIGIFREIPGGYPFILANGEKKFIGPRKSVRMLPALVSVDFERNISGP